MPSACVLTKYGPPSVLEWAEVAMPEPSKGEIRIQAIVSGVGPTDLKIRRGSLSAVDAKTSQRGYGAVNMFLSSKIPFRCKLTNTQ